MTHAKQYAILFFSVFMLLFLFYPKDTYANGMSAEGAQTLYESVKSDYQSITYDDLYDLLNPYVSSIEKLNIRTAMTKELGRTPTDDEIQSRIRQIYMDKLGMRDAFNSVMQDLDTVFPKLLEHSTDTTTASYLTTNKDKILLGLTYLEKYYGFTVSGVSAKDILLYNTESYFNVSKQDALTIVTGLSSITYEEAKANNTAVVYTNKLSWVTGADEITDFLETLASSEKHTGSEFFKKTSSAVIKETSPASDFFEKAKKDTRLKSSLLPLLNLSSDSIYIISTTHTTTIGLTSSYGGRDSETLKTALNKTALSQQAFLDFWQRTSKTANALTISPEILLIDTFATSETEAVSDCWSAESGDTADPGVAEFMTPMEYYRTYMFANAEADTNSHLIQFFISKCLTDSGVNTYTHELTHLYDETVWLNGAGRRDGAGNETFATGLFESENNTQATDGTGSSYAPIFSLNTAYELGSNRIQNQSPSRFQSTADIQQYMQGLMDLIYTLDIIEAEEILKLSDDDKAILLNRVTLVDDETSAQNTNRKLDCFEHITVQDAATLTTIDDLVDNNIVSGRLIPKGSNTTQTIAYNDYVVIPMFEGVYAGVQNDNGTVGDFLFKRYAYELLAEYGWEDGFIAYISNRYANDKEALEHILNPDYAGNLSTFKKEMFRRRSNRMHQLKPTETYPDTESMRLAIRTALQSDLAAIKDGIAGGTDYYMLNVKNLQSVKTEILNEYLILTNDFTQSIYTETTDDSDLPPGGDIPSGDDVPSGGDTPSGDDVPSGGDTPSGGDVPSGGDTPSGGDASPGNGTILLDSKSGASYKVTSTTKDNLTVSYYKPKSKKITKVTIPSTVTINGYKYKVTSIAKNAFKNCRKLKKITIGKYVTTIGSKAFYGCKSLKTIIIKTQKLKLQKVGKQAFKGTSSKATVKVPKSKYKAYKKILKKRGAGKNVTFKKA